ncbi:MAG: RsmE family RNA methyltransferase [Candidatus Aminicenantales bacterium]
MTLHHFFVRQENINFPRAIIKGPENHHLYRVLRLRKGEKVRIFNENNELFAGIVEEASPGQTVVLLEKTIDPTTAQPLNVALIVAQACLKAKQMDWLIKRLTELRIASFIPLLTRRTVVRLEREAADKIKRWQRLAIQAAKQCQSPLVPQIRPPSKLADFLALRPEEIKYYLSERGGKVLREILLGDCFPGVKNKPGSAVLCIGPEGGWEEEEEELLQTAGFQPVSLGRGILRAETASLVAASILAHFWNA